MTMDQLRNIELGLIGVDRSHYVDPHKGLERIKLPQQLTNKHSLSKEERDQLELKRPGKTSVFKV